MGQCTLEIGLTIDNVATGKKSGQMARFMRAPLSMARRKDKVDWYKLTKPNMKDNSTKIKFMEWEPTCGAMGKGMTVPGSRAKCTAKAG